MKSLLSAAVEQVALATDGETRGRERGEFAAPAGTPRNNVAPPRGLEHPTSPPHLAHPAGCPLAQLWEALAGAAEEVGVQLDAPAVRTALWRLLLAEPGLRCAVPRWGQLGVAGTGRAVCLACTRMAINVLCSTPREATLLKPPVPPSLSAAATAGPPGDCHPKRQKPWAALLPPRRQACACWPAATCRMQLWGCLTHRSCGLPSQIARQAAACLAGTNGGWRSLRVCGSGLAEWPRPNAMPLASRPHAILPPAHPDFTSSAPLRPSCPPFCCSARRWR